MRICLLAFVVLVAFSQASHASVPDKTEITQYTEELLAEEFAKDGPGVAVLVARGDEILFRGARGMASIELDVPLKPNQVFRIASITKQFASAAILRLIEQGKLSLGDPLSKFVPGYPGGEKITLRMLLNHTSGIRSFTDIPGQMPWQDQKDMTTAELIDFFKNEKPDFAPGSHWNYSNSGYVLVGAVIEAVSGMSWHAYLDKSFFTPLRMDHTGYGDEAARVIPGHVVGYAYADDHWVVSHHLSMTQPHASGSLVSNVDDLQRWSRALHGGKVLSPESYAQMTTPIGAAADQGYGFGIRRTTLRGATLLMHSGSIWGFNSAQLYMPDSETTVVVLANFQEGTPNLPGATELAQKLAAFSIGKPYPKKLPIVMNADTLKSYEGVYRIDKDLVRILKVVNGKLTSQRTGLQPHAMLPIARDEFLYEDDLSRALFERDSGGKVSAIRFIPDDEGEGKAAPLTNEPVP